MTPDFFDDDENVKAMRETAQRIGLTQLLIDGAGDLALFVNAPEDIADPADTAEFLSNAVGTFMEALRLLGFTPGQPKEGGA